MAVMLSYRRATLDDLSFLIQLRRLTMSEHLQKAGLHLTEQQHQEKVQEFFNDTQIILLNNKAVGALKLGLFSSSLHIRQFQISPKMQGKGIGSRVLQDVINRAIKIQQPITLNVLLANPAKGLYLRHGFVVCAENEFEYQMRYPLNK
jgi:ribosomal protein S18 acetylase RimI-like enzyme